MQTTPAVSKSSLKGQLFRSHTDGLLQEVKKTETTPPERRRSKGKRKSSGQKLDASRNEVANAVSNRDMFEQCLRRAIIFELGGEKAAALQEYEQCLCFDKGNELVSRKILRLREDQM